MFYIILVKFYFISRISAESQNMFDLTNMESMMLFSQATIIILLLIILLALVAGNFFLY